MTPLSPPPEGPALRALTPSAVLLFAAFPGACRATVAAVLVAAGVGALGTHPTTVLVRCQNAAVDGGWSRQTYRAVRAGLLAMARHASDAAQNPDARDPYGALLSDPRSARFRLTR